MDTSIEKTLRAQKDEHPFNPVIKKRKKLDYNDSQHTTVVRQHLILPA
jgi:hypothetical protein